MSVKDRIDALIKVHGLPCSPRKVLQGRHATDEFSLYGCDDNDEDGRRRRREDCVDSNNNNNDSDDHDLCLFYRFARVVCRADKVPRKELFEAWAMALHVHEKFPHIRRFADLACGHGLVSWALLVLYQYSSITMKKMETKKEEDGSARTIQDDEDKPYAVSAVCIDIHMPLAAERLEHLMMEEFPELVGRWDYVEGSIHAMIPAPETLLVGVHACKSLSDMIIENAIYGNSNMALVPCCHAKSCLNKSQQAFWDIHGPGFMNLAAYLDGIRIQTLQDAGFYVQEHEIPEAITPKNRLIFARPSNEEGSTPQRPTTRLEPSKAFSHFCIPLEDTEDARAIIKSLSGKKASTVRKAPSAISLGLVLYLSKGQEVLADQVRGLAKTLSLDTQIEHVNQQIYYDPKLDQYSRTFRVLYTNDFDKESAKAKHIQLCHAIETQISGVRVRQVPRLLTVLELEMYLPIGPSDSCPYLEVSEEDISKAVSTILPMETMDTNNTIQVKRVGTSTFRRRGEGRYVRLFRMHYSNIVHTLALQYHQEMKRNLSNVIPGVLIL